MCLMRLKSTGPYSKKTIVSHPPPVFTVRKRSNLFYAHGGRATRKVPKDP